LHCSYTTAIALRDPASPLSKRSVYYDFDSFVVKDEFRPTVEAHGRYLRDNKAARVVVQGNTDERGSGERKPGDRVLQMVVGQR